MAFNAFRKHEITMTCLGISPIGMIRNKWLAYLYDFYFVVLLMIGLMWSVLFSYGAFFYLPSFFMDRIVGLSAAVSVVGSLAKLITFRMNRDILQELYQELGGFPVLTKRGKLVSKVNTIFEVTVAAIIITHNMHMPLGFFNRASPFWTLSPTSGENIEILRDYLINLVCSIVCLSANVMGDTLFLTLVNQICHRIFLLSNTLSSIGKSTRSEDILPLIQDATDSEIIKKCIEEHNLMLTLTNKVEKLYDKIILAQLFYSFLDTILTLFTVSQYGNFMEAVQQLLPQFISLFLELFLYCWGGQMINDHFEHLHFSIYDSDWHTLKKEDRTSIFIMLTFSGKSVILKSTTIFQMNYQAFESICKEVFSYYTVMRQFFSQN